MLGRDECCRTIKSVELGPVLSVMDRLPFVHVNQGGATATSYGCDVVLKAHFPKELDDLIAGLDLGGRLARAVVRKLAPFQSIPPHVDKWMPAEVDWRRFQIPLVTHPEIVMRWPDDGVSVHLEAGWLYEVRFDRLHEVVHPVDCERIHLQVDQIDAVI